jgi:uncharacterized protein (UPF0332 family)
VSDRIPALLARSRTELDASRVLASAGFIDQAISRAYYGSFYAAEAALMSLGETRSKHSGVVAAFGRLVVREGGFDEKLGGELRRLFELRNVADYSWLDVPGQTGDEPIAAAQRFVEGVEGWVEQRSQ